jgi:hypothetical protein
MEKVVLVKEIEETAQGGEIRYTSAVKYKFSNVIRSPWPYADQECTACIIFEKMGG